MIINYILLFYFYSFIGWIIESILVSIKEKKIKNRGFMFGPVCPIYGIGAVLITFLIKEISFINILKIIALCLIVEYAISYIMERIFNLRWWDYSNRKFNLNGRVCLENTIYFAIFGVVIIKYINPYILDKINHLSFKTSVVLIAFLSIVYLTDWSISLFLTYKIRRRKTINRDSTDMIKTQIKKMVKSIF